MPRFPITQKRGPDRRILAAAPLFAGLDIKLLAVGCTTSGIRDGLEVAQTRLRAAGHAPTIEITPGQPENVISEVVERDGIDPLVMSAFGHSRIPTMIIGSTTAEMMRSCKVPIVLFR